jgi:hypothetical protein
MLSLLTEERTWASCPWLGVDGTNIHLPWCDVIVIPAVSFVVIGGYGVNNRTGLVAVV